MNDLYQNLENRRVRELAREYQKMGYQVITEPGPDALPDFLQAYRPNILAQKDGENVIVEVKSKKSLPQSEYLEEVAQILEQKEGWRLELVLTNPRGNQLDHPLPSLSLIKEKYEQARQIRRMNQAEAAFLLKASCLEALIRILFQEEQPRLDIELEPVAYTRQLFSYGMLDKSDYLRLRSIAEKISRLRQGFFSSENGPSEEDEKNFDLVIQQLIRDIEQGELRS